jgi:threonine synthase
MDLRCPDCDRTYHDRWRCQCGAPLEFAKRPRPARAAHDVDPREGLWTFAPLLPIQRRVSLGEGYTPLVDAPDSSATFKLEYVSPTGSFKDRGAATTLSRAVAVGADRVLEDSSGNAGAATATYAARAGLPAEIYVPADATPSKLNAIRRAGADLVTVDGARSDVSDACIDAVVAEAGWYASHVWNPAFLAGTATMAYEIAHQRNWSVPDALVLPIGHGTLFLGAYRGFRALEAAGWTDRTPRLFGAQAAGHAPIVAAVRGEDAAAGENAVADGIRIEEPVRQAEIRAAIDETGGDAIAVSAESVRQARNHLHASGFSVESTAAVAPAALRVYRARGELDADDEVVVPLTGSGSKQ